MFEQCNLAWQVDCASIENNTRLLVSIADYKPKGPISNRNIGNWIKYQSQLAGIIAQIDSELTP